MLGLGSVLVAHAVQPYGFGTATGATTSRGRDVGIAGELAATV